MANNINHRMMTSSDVANTLHLHINAVRRWSDHGLLKPYRIGPRGDRRFVYEDIMNYLISKKYFIIRSQYSQSIPKQNRKVPF
jgi:hypothetical protein